MASEGGGACCREGREGSGSYARIGPRQGASAVGMTLDLRSERARVL